MIITFFDGLDMLYHHAKFGEDSTMRTNCRCENMVFVCLSVFLSCSEAGALFVRGGLLSAGFFVTVDGSIVMPFSAFFSEGIALSDGLDSSYFHC